MPERARTDPWEPQGSNPLGPPGPELVPGTTPNYACSLSVASPHLTLFPRLNLIGFPGEKPEKDLVALKLSVDPEVGTFGPVGRDGIPSQALDAVEDGLQVFDVPGETRWHGRRLDRLSSRLVRQWIHGDSPIAVLLLIPNTELAGCLISHQAGRDHTDESLQPPGIRRAFLFILAEEEPSTRFNPPGMFQGIGAKELRHLQLVRFVHHFREDPIGGPAPLALIHGLEAVGELGDGVDGQVFQYPKHEKITRVG